MKYKEIEDITLNLSAEDRAKLAQKLLLSLDSMTDEEIEEAWLIEADERAREIDRGEVIPIPADEMRKKVRSLLR